MKKDIIITSIALTVILLVAGILLAVRAIYINASDKEPSSPIKRLEKEYGITLPEDLIMLYSGTWVGGYPIAKLQIFDDDVNSMRDMLSNSYLDMSNSNVYPIQENSFPEEWGWLDDMKHVVYRYQKGFDPHKGRSIGTCWIYFIKTPTGENYLYLWKM